MRHTTCLQNSYLISLKIFFNLIDAMKTEGGEKILHKAALSLIKNKVENNFQFLYSYFIFHTGKCLQQQMKTDAG